MQTMNEVRKANADQFNTQTRSQLYKQWQRFTAADSDSFRIGIWGTTGAGKTTFLTMLYDALLLRPGWTVAADSKARKFVTSQLKTIRMRGRFPAPTEVTAEIDIFRYILQEEKNGQSEGEYRQITLDFVDAPGEFYERPHLADRRVSGEMDILDYLSSCDGIIFLLDPDRMDDGLADDEDDYRTMLMDLMLEFQERSISSGISDDLRLEQYMAFCITKSDKGPYWDHREAPQNLAEGVMGDTMYRMLGANFLKHNRYQFFSVSAIGRYQDPKSGEWVENINYSNGADQTNGTSHNGVHAAEPVITTTNIGVAYEPAITTATTSETLPSEPPQPRPSASWLPEPSDLATPPVATTPASTSIAQRKAITPFNVLEPLDWLITSMRREPPAKLIKR
ncbi:MAG: hypothetical protein AAF629_05185 [Chloroflexota bacterium]